MQCPSFLVARDPSIISWNAIDYQNAKKKLKFSGESDIQENDEVEDHCIKVFLRIKNDDLYKEFYTATEKELICTLPEGSHALRNVRDGDKVIKKYTFSKIFEPKCTQTEIFDYVVKPKILSFLNGMNNTILTYGASGSGKTYTVVGTDSEPGLIPRALEYIFRSLPKVASEPRIKPLSNGVTVTLNDNEFKTEEQFKQNILKTWIHDRTMHTKIYNDMKRKLVRESVAEVNCDENVTLGIWVSFAEIYNESIYDLLQPPPSYGKSRPRLMLGRNNNNNYIKKLTTVSVSSSLEAYQILQYGIQNLIYAATNINSHSSRSHSIFTVMLVQSGNKRSHISNFSFCDLAGAERLKKTCNVGDRLEESKNINRSLLVLGKCIQSIRNAQKTNDHRLIPFRESKLTQLFQNALSGLENIIMIVNVNPSKEMFDESQHVLNFSAIAKDIIVEQVKVLPKLNCSSRFSKYMENKSSLVEHSRLEAELDYYKNLVVDLKLELQRRNLEEEENVNAERERLITGYQNLMEEREKLLNRDWRKQLQQELNKMKSSYEKYLKNMIIEISEDSSECEEEEDEEQVEMENKSNSNIIKKFERNMRRYSENLETNRNNEKLPKVSLPNLNLIKDVSENEETKAENSSVDELTKRIQELEKELKQSKSKPEEIEKETSSLVEELRRKNEDLQQTLQDAVQDYKELIEQNSELKNVIKDLTEQNLVLHEKLEQLASFEL